MPTPIIVDWTMSEANQRPEYGCGETNGAEEEDREGVEVDGVLRTQSYWPGSGGLIRCDRGRRR